MFSVFDKSGIFIAACRHQFILFVCDMVKSGELCVILILILSSSSLTNLLSSKYPLAILDHLLNVYGKNGGIAYNISYTFSKMLEHSCLGLHTHELNLRMMVGAFHDHAHNQWC